MIIAKYKFNNTLYDLIPEFNSGYTGYYYSDEIYGDITTRTIEAATLPTIVNFGIVDTPTDRELSLLEVLYIDISDIISMENMFMNCTNVTTILGLDATDNKYLGNIRHMCTNCTNLKALDISNCGMTESTVLEGAFDNTPQLQDIGLLKCTFEMIDKIGNITTAKLWVTPETSMIHYTGVAPYDTYEEHSSCIHLNTPLLKGDELRVYKGKLCHYHKMGMVVLDGSEGSWWRHSLTDDENHANVLVSCIALPNAKKGTSVVCDRFPQSYSINTSESVYFSGDILVLTINRNKLNNSSELSSLKTWLQANPTTVVYELEVPWYEDITPLQDIFVVNSLRDGKLLVNTALPVEVGVTYSTNIESVATLKNDIEETRAETILLTNIADDIINE